MVQPATNSAGALQNLQQAQASSQTPQQMIAGANQQFGVDQAQQQVSGLQKAIGQTTNLLNQVAPSVMGRTQNSLVTSAQANNQIAQQSAPIQANLQNDTQAYSQANTDYANKEQQAQQLVGAEQTGQANQQSYLQGIYSDLATAEQSAAQAQEAKREFGVGQANSLKTNAAQPFSYDNSSRDDWVTAIKSQFASELGQGNYGWQAIAKQLQQEYGTIPTGSNADQALHLVFTGVA